MAELTFSSAGKHATGQRLDRARLTLLLVIAAVVLFAAAQAAPHGTPLNPLKALAIQGGILAMGLLCIWSVWHNRTPGAFFRTGPNLAILLYLIWAQISYQGSPFWPYGLPSLLGIASGAVLYFVVAYGLPRRWELRWIVRALGAAVLVNVVARVIVRHIYREAPTIASFGNTQFDGAVFSLLCLLLFACARAETHKGWRIFMHCTAIGALTCLLTSECRSAWMGATAGALFMLGERLWSLRRRGAQGWTEARGRALTGGAAASLFIILLLFLGGWAHLVSRAGTFAGLSGDSTVRWRLEMAQIGGRLLATRPLTGWGLGSFPVFAGHFSREAQEPEAVLRRGATLAELPHSEYVQIAAETGGIGLFLYAAILASFLIYCGRSLARQESRYLRYLTVGCMAATVAYTVDATGNAAWRFPEVSLFFWLTAGMGAAAARTAAAGATGAAGPQASGEGAAAAARPAAVRVARAALLTASFGFAAGLGGQVAAAVKHGGQVAGVALTSYLFSTTNNQPLPSVPGLSGQPFSAPPGGVFGASGGPGGGGGGAGGRAVKPGIDFKVLGSGRFAFDEVGFPSGAPCPCCCCELKERPGLAALQPGDTGQPRGKEDVCCARCGDKHGHRNAPGRSVRWCRHTHTGAGHAPAAEVEKRPGVVERGGAGDAERRDCGCGQAIELAHIGRPPRVPANAPSWRTLLPAGGVESLTTLCEPRKSGRQKAEFRCSMIRDLRLVASDMQLAPGGKSDLRLFAQIAGHPGWYDFTDYHCVRFEMVGISKSEKLGSGLRYIVSRDEGLRSTGGKNAAGGPYTVRARLFCHQSDTAISAFAP